MAHALMDNRHGLVSDFRLTEANGMAERDAALDMMILIPGILSHDAWSRQGLRQHRLRC